MKRGREKPFVVSSLPEDVRAAMVVREAERSAPRLPGAETAIPEWANQRGLDRYQVVATFREQTRRAKTTKGEATRAFLQAYNSGHLLPRVFERLGTVSRPTLYRWDKQLREQDDDYRVLCDRRGSWTQGGPKGLGQLDPVEQRIFLGCYLDPNKPSMHLAYKATEKILTDQGRRVPSYRTFVRFIKRFDSHHHDLVVLKREGEKALMDKVGKFALRNDRILEVGDVLIADGHDLNFDVIHPVTGKPCRMVLVVFQDWRSRMPCGWEIMPTESTVCISSALRKAILNLGKYPRVVYLDNGRAFKAKYFTATGQEFQDLNGLYARLGIAVQHAIPYHGRSKPVERYFGTFNEQAERLVASYCGANINDKPAWRLRNEPYHQSRHSGHVPTVEEACRMFGLYVEWYGRNLHRGINQYPLEVFEAGRGDGSSIDLDDLDRHFLFTKKLRPSRCGFTLAGIRYESDALYGMNQDILIKWSWSDLSAVQLYSMEGHRLGEATPTEAIHPMAKLLGTELDQLQVKEANRKQRELKRATLRMAKELDCDLGESGLAELPWMKGQKRPLALVHKAAPQPEQPAMSAEEKARLTAVAQEAKAAREAAPAYSAPEFFASPLERYEFLFGISVRQGLELTEEDAAFMRSFEASREWEYCRGRFEQLRALYAARHNQQEVAG